MPMLQNVLGRYSPPFEKEEIAEDDMKTMDRATAQISRQAKIQRRIY
jgi:hypothetical protein